MAGWIRLDRKLFYGDMAEDGYLQLVWIQLLAMAQWNDNSKVRIGADAKRLLRGQISVSIRQLAAQTRFNKNTIERCLKYLENTGRIRQDKGHHGTIVTICKYDKYQTISDATQTPQGQHKGHHEGHHRDTTRDTPQTPTPKNTSDSSELQPPNKGTINKVTKEQGTTNAFPPADADRGADHTVEPHLNGAESEPKPAKRVRPVKVIDPNEQKAGSFAFDCFARHYEARYGVKPLRDRMANVHAKAIAESIPRDDIDAFMQCYLANPSQYYVQKAHPLALARIDVQKIHTEMLTGMRLSANKARQYETVSETAEAGKRWLSKIRGGDNAKP